MRHRGVHHVSINVDDLDAGRAFYVDALGFEEMPRPDLGIGGCWLRMGPQELHLIERPVPRERGPHFALGVDDLDAATTELRDRGVDVSDAITIEGICRQAFFDDPAGNQIELNQRL